MQRRVFLRAAALGLAAPAALQLSRLALAQSGAAPKRLFIFHMPHGVPHLHYNPKVMGSDLTQFTLSDSNVSILGPLEPYKKYVNVYQGFSYPEGGGPHFDAVHFLTDSADVTDTSPRLSFDHAIAQKLNVKPLTLGASAQPLGSIQPYSKVFWDGTGYVEAEKNPVKAADKVFGGLSAPSGPNPDQEARKAILSLTAGEIESLQKDVLGLTSEHNKLQAHLDAVLALREGKGTSGMLSCTTAPKLPSVEQIRALNMPDETAQGTPNWYLGDYQGDNANFPLLLAAQLELSAQAIACNAAQIVTLQAMFSTSQQNFGFMGISRPHHLGISHVGPDMNVTMPSDPMVTDFGKAQRWFTEQLVKYVVEPLAMMDDPAAPGTKVLDNTIIYLTSEIADGQWHNLTSGDIPSYHPGDMPFVRQYLPLVTIGGGAGALKTQRIVRNAMDRPAADLYLTLAQAMGAPLTSFGASTGVVQEVLA
jgi:hypothetical protein